MGATKVLLLLGEVSCTVVPLRRTGKVRLLSVSAGGPGGLVSELPVTLGSYCLSVFTGKWRKYTKLECCDETYRK